MNGTIKEFKETLEEMIVSLLESASRELARILNQKIMDDI